MGKRKEIVKNLDFAARGRVVSLICGLCRVDGVWDRVRDERTQSLLYLLNHRSACRWYSIKWLGDEALGRL